ncbi:MAG: transcription antitermination factor NusB, partial [Gammaproteobacteria bacterium]
QWQLSHQDVCDIETQFLAEQDMVKLEIPYFQELLRKIPAHLDELDAHIAPVLDRPLENVDPVERAILRIGTYELVFRLDVPYRVVINEGVEMAKVFGGEEGYKYVNGILDKLAYKLRKAEITGKRSAIQPH